MGFRFRKSIKIAPGIKLNINKKSVGMTFGTRGTHYTVNSKGTRTKSVGIPGTGLSYTDVEKGKKISTRRSADNAQNSNSSKGKGCGCGCLILVIILIFVVYLILEY